MTIFQTIRTAFSSAVESHALMIWQNYPAMKAWQVGPLQQHVCYIVISILFSAGRYSDSGEPSAKAQGSQDHSAEVTEIHFSYRCAVIIIIYYISFSWRFYPSDLSLQHIHLLYIYFLSQFFQY